MENLPPKTELGGSILHKNSDRCQRMSMGTTMGFSHVAEMFHF